LLQNKRPVSGNGEPLLKALVEDNLFLPGCVLLRRNMQSETGEFTKGIEGIEDWDFFYRAALLKKTFQHDSREGTRLLGKGHDTNASNNGFRMLTHKLRARKSLMLATAQAAENATGVFSKVFLEHVNNLHKGYLNRDAARLHLFYGSLSKGCLHMVKHAWFSKRFYFSFYDGGYWIKERVKKKFSRQA
jgi:hypothetical protein